MKQSLADRLEAFAKDAGSVSGYARDQFLKTLGGCTRRNIGEITAALREREARIYQPFDPSLESRSEKAVFIGGMWPYGNSTGGTKPEPSSDIPCPPPEQEVKHLAKQCAALIAENEQLRTSRGWSAQEYEAVRDACEKLRVENDSMRAALEKIAEGRGATVYAIAHNGVAIARATLSSHMRGNEK